MKNAKSVRKDTKTMKQKLKSNLPKRRKDYGKKVGVFRSKLKDIFNKFENNVFVVSPNALHCT